MYSLTSGPLLWIALFKITVHLFFISEYDFFRDELYYIACSKRPDLGYVDQPPFSIWLLGFVRWIGGDSIIALRLPAILAGGGLVMVTGGIARQLGAGRFGETLAGLAVLVSPIYLGLHKFYSMNAFDLLFWALAFWILLRILRVSAPTNGTKEAAPRRLWIWLGLVVGFGLLNKHSLLFFGFGLAVGLIGTRRRRLLLTPGPYIAGAVALSIFAPHLWWQYANELPTFEFMTNARLYKNVAFAPLNFLGGVVLEIHPVLAPIWILGLGALLSARSLAFARLVGIAFLSLLLLFMFTGGKTYYLAAAFPPLLAAGAVALEKLTAAGSVERFATGLRGSIVALVLLAGAITAPMAMPMLPIGTYTKYQDWLGIGPPAHERHHTGAVPQHFADMFGWRELAAGVGEVYESLETNERERALILARNYGFAGAIELFGRQDLPRVLSGHNNYYLWSKDATELDVVIAAGMREEDLRAYFADVRPAGATHCEFCLPDRRTSRIFICRQPRLPPAEFWARVKRFI